MVRVRILSTLEYSIGKTVAKKTCILWIDMITHHDVSLLFAPLRRHSLLRKRASRGSPLFRMRARRLNALSRFVFGYKMELEKCNRICLQFIFVTKRATNTLSRKQTTCFLGVVSDDDDSEESVVLFSSSLVVSFLIRIRCGRLRRPTEIMSSSC